MFMAIFMTIFELAGMKDEKANMGISMACSLLAIVLTASVLAQ